ncbi:MAG: hypothetical protein AB4040_07115 [Synechococcus sp.]
MSTNTTVALSPCDRWRDEGEDDALLIGATRIGLGLEEIEVLKEVSQGEIVMLGREEGCFFRARAETETTDRGNSKNKSSRVAA